MALSGGAGAGDDDAHLGSEQRQKQMYNTLGSWSSNEFGAVSNDKSFIKSRRIRLRKRT